MNKQQLLANLEELGMRPGRGLGQNFLLDSNLLDFIVKKAGVRPGETILETGPGFGALTSLMLDAGATVYSIEFDHRLIAFLRKHLQNPNFHLIEGDACKVDFQSQMPPGPFRAVANLPYAISTVFIARLLELDQPPEEMVFMLQKEMAQRLASAPGTGSYGALSVRTQLLFEVEIARIVPPEVFFPPPQVDSAIVRFTRQKALPSAHLRKYLPGVVKNAFSQRRKQLGKVLGQCYGREKAVAALAEIGYAPDIRPDKLSCEDFARLTLSFFPEPR